MADATLGAVLIIVAVLCLAGSFLAVLAYINRHGRVRSSKPSRPKPKWARWAIIFFQHILLELIGLVFTILGIIGLETKDWDPLDISAVRAAFYVFTSLKYALLIAGFVIDQWYPGLERRIAIKLRIRPDWMEQLDLLIFIPSILIDGALVNAEYHLGDTGDVVDFDSVALAVIDTLLYTKAMMTSIIRTHSDNFKAQFDLVQISFAMVSFAYTLSTAVLVIVIHLNNVPERGMAVSAGMVIIIINVLIHPYLSAYSSMIRQGIIALDRALKGTQFRVTQLKAFITYFSSGPVWRALTVVIYGFMMYVYISIAVVAGTTASDAREEPFIRVLVNTTVVTVLLLDIFYLVNFGFSIVKRIGGLLGWRYPFNCETYSRALSQAGVRINIDAHQRIAGV